MNVEINKTNTKFGETGFHAIYTWTSLSRDIKESPTIQIFEGKVQEEHPTDTPLVHSLVDVL